MQDLDEELRDVVFDYENSLAIAKVADDFLKNPDKPPSIAYDDVQSVNSKASKASTTTSHIHRNIQKAGVYNPYKVNYKTDRLTDD